MQEGYGIYVVRAGTLLDLRRLLGPRKVAVKDFEHEVSQKTVTANSMYLDIISKFGKFTCVVYVQGLSRLEDSLLKWVAEYTHHHPWRFVFFENIDASWNYSENRDRCNFTFAPESPSLVIRELSDLEAPRIARIRLAGVLCGVVMCRYCRSRLSIAGHTIRRPTPKFRRWT